MVEDRLPLTVDDVGIVRQTSQEQDEPEREKGWEKGASSEPTILVQ